MKRRALVLTSEAAGHPFRRSLPPHVATARFPADVEAADNAEARRAWRLNGSDWRGFLSAYCASLVAITVFIT
ncbi:hypothetical protein WBP07_03770 [Novosphingobium sp. BL-8A]|uniref:hypothetical protein n=1 Tax=Novosphingobium sp. BL-8A TaxID=3127639 RepID=UPI003756E89B